MGMELDFCLVLLISLISLDLVGVLKSTGFSNCGAKGFSECATTQHYYGFFQHPIFHKLTGLKQLIRYINCNVQWYKEVDIFLFVNSSKSKSPDASVPESCHSKSDDEQEEILGSDDDEQESPQDYCKGKDCKY